MLSVERDKLRKEKINVIQRLTEVNRARDLIVLSSGFTHIRNSHHAINAYLTQLPSTDELIY